MAEVKTYDDNSFMPLAASTIQHAKLIQSVKIGIRRSPSLLEDHTKSVLACA